MNPKKRQADGQPVFDHPSAGEAVSRRCPRAGLSIADITQSLRWRVLDADSSLGPRC
ncbi:MAG: hypothetical protein GWN84_16140 [Gammaproteobacteria bacterium]|nr:hypothetical protein [Gammaproteobacteria bacterium]NIR89834.1 hypothetical protein [Gammaproteobacteria bacterium]NIU05701.1 hypothetical protein [Gammaproteobacteria bacterium]NIV52461.1 hypothetical protein [Gammaproteobacteria bacterium]NIW86429.1 hypothetical protein [Gammaproteobacteria bacterium]